MGILATATAVIASVLGVITAWALITRRRAIRRLRRGAHLAHTARGQVEYALVGSGPAVLVLHGGVGGWDQGVMLGVSLLAPDVERTDYRCSLADGDRLLRGRYGLVAPSRTGYLRTPLTTGRTPAEGADAMAALLDALKLDRVLVVGVSGGGPTALQFALRHPHRTVALVQVAAITRRHVQPGRTTDSLVGRIVFARGMAWALDLAYGAGVLYASLCPKSFCRRLLSATETLDGPGLRARLDRIRLSPDQLRWMRGLIESGYPLSPRKDGLDNDLAQFAAIEDYPVEQIRCPTLVIHGRFDGNVPIEHAEFVARGVSGAQLVVAETCGHVLWMSDEEPRIRQTAQAFLSQHAARATIIPGLRRG